MPATGKEIKNRIKSIESTRQITKAMGLVASSKLGRAKERVELTRPYFNMLHSTLTDIAYTNRDFTSPYVRLREVKRRCFIIIAGDRGLAGGYNSNVMKLAAKEMGSQENVLLVPVGKKTLEYTDRQGLELLSRDYAEVSAIGTDECYEIAYMLCEGFLKGNFDELYVVYTNFVSMLDQTPACLKLLPLHREHGARQKAEMQILYEPSSEEVYDAIVPEYLAGVIYGAVCESACAELAARHTAMDAASKNADEMIEALQLSYNQARQGAITQEITEIIAGSGDIG